MKNLDKALENLSKMRTLAEIQTETIEPSDKQGYDFKIVKLGDVELYREYIPTENPSTEDGTYTNPFRYVEGMEIVESKWYFLYDKDLPHEAIKSGVPSGFYDTEYFDFVEEIPTKEV